MSMGQNKIARGAVWVIMGLVVVGLVGFGSFNFGGGGQSIGRVGDTPISANRYFREVNAQLESLYVEGKWTPRHYAVAYGHHDLVALLDANGAEEIEVPLIIGGEEIRTGR